MGVLKIIKKKQEQHDNEESLRSKLLKIGIGIALYSLIICIVYIIGYSFYSIWADYTSAIVKKLFWSSVVLAIIDFAFLKSLDHK